MDPSLGHRPPLAELPVAVALGDLLWLSLWYLGCFVGIATVDGDDHEVAFAIPDDLHGDRRNIDVEALDGLDAEGHRDNIGALLADRRGSTKMPRVAGKQKAAVGVRDGVRPNVDQADLRRYLSYVQERRPEAEEWRIELGSVELQSLGISTDREVQKLKDSQHL